MSFDGAAECIDCSTGTYSTAASTACFDCAIGTADVDEDPATACAACGAGQFAAAGSTVCSNCPAGTFEEVAGGSEASCIACPVGTYAQPTECVECPAGHPDSDSDPATACDASQCASGKFAPAGSTVCTDCAPGTADLDTDSRTECEACAAGTYAELQSVMGVASGRTECTECGAGLSDTDTDPTTPCIPCFPGTSQATPGSSGDCPVCPAGTYSEDANVPCETCAAGMYTTEGEAFCHGCRPGRHDADSDAATECEDCPAGRYNTDSSKTTCAMCMPGTEQLEAGSTECLEIDGCIGNPCDDNGDAGAVCQDLVSPDSGNECICNTNGGWVDQDFTGVCAKAALIVRGEATINGYISPADFEAGVESAIAAKQDEDGNFEADRAAALAAGDATVPDDTPAAVVKVVHYDVIVSSIARLPGSAADYADGTDKKRALTYGLQHASCGDLPLHDCAIVVRSITRRRMLLLADDDDSAQANITHVAQQTLLRRLQAGSTVSVEFSITTDVDISQNLEGQEFLAAFVEACHDPEAGPGLADLTVDDISTDEPSYETSIEYTVLTTDSASASIAEAALNDPAAMAEGLNLPAGTTFDSPAGGSSPSPTPTPPTPPGPVAAPGPGPAAAAEEETSYVVPIIMVLVVLALCGGGVAFFLMQKNNDDGSKDANGNTDNPLFNELANPMGAASDSDDEEQQAAARLQNLEQQSPKKKKTKKKKKEDEGLTSNPMHSGADDDDDELDFMD
jgi:hypothetical protein